MNETQDQKVGRVLRESSRVVDKSRKTVRRAETVTRNGHQVIGHTQRINKNFAKLADMVTNIQKNIVRDQRWC